METLDCLAARVSANAFDPERAVDPEDLRDLVRWACRAPSSFNLQHWRFVALTEPAERARLAAATRGQELPEAPVVLIVLGDLRAHEDLADALRPTVEKGELPKATADGWIQAANRAYGHPQAARDEALRSASMAAMCLMLAARDRGIVSAPVFLLDADAVRREFAISDRYVPALVLALGYPAPGEPQRQKVRVPIGKVLHEGSGESLPD